MRGTGRITTSSLLRFLYNSFSYNGNNSQTVTTKVEPEVGSRRNYVYLWLGEYARPLVGVVDIRQNYSNNMVRHSASIKMDKEILCTRTSLR